MYLTTIIVIENKMHLVKRVFAKLVLNAARNDKSAYQQVRQNEDVEAPSTRWRDFYRPHHGNSQHSLASATDAGLTAYV
jgi:hypothetical protein